MIIGHHILYGKVVELDSPMVTMVKQQTITSSKTLQNKSFQLDIVWHSSHNKIEKR